MTKRMLIDATDPAETRVVVLGRNRVEEFDHEIRSKAQLKGNIYLAKVTRVEPSLQAAFVDYGGNRHGFLPFSEIHPDYYRIPIADREALLAEEAAIRAQAAVEEDEEAEALASVAEQAETFESEAETREHEHAEDSGPAAWVEAAGDEEAAAAAEERPSVETVPAPETTEDASAAPAEQADESWDEKSGEATEETPDAEESDDEEPEDGGGSGRALPHVASTGEQRREEPADEDARSEESAADGGKAEEDRTSFGAAEPEAPFEQDGGPATAVGPEDARQGRGGNGSPVEEIETEEQVDTIEGDEIEDVARRRAKLLRRYKIQEVIKRGQVMLVQVAKEERGNKGAALTTYLSLPGRYCVLMPNTARGGGISRKIGSSTDRRRLKQVLGDLDIPDGMAVIVRTAGSERSKAEIKRDYEYLVRLWSEIREITLQSQAPALIYEEGNLIKRAIRDLYTSDTEEIVVEGEESYKAAKAFMKSLMPSHARRVQLYKDPTAPLFQKYQVESQLAAMFESTVQLKSGGYIVINVTEALVAIDVNSGKATRERHIEETALKTNLEASDEVARQLRLRDLAGLIVVDFIDMEETRHNRDVERRLKEAMKNDRARIQLGRISPFGLLELSRQRLRPSLVETATIVCPHCHGVGRVYSAETAALHFLRALSEEGMKHPGAELTIAVPTRVALYLLNHKREQLAAEEARYSLTLRVETDDRLSGLEHRIERAGQPAGGRQAGERERGRDRGQRDERQRGEREGERQRTESEAAPQRAERGGERAPRDRGNRGERRGRGRRGDGERQRRPEPEQEQERLQAAPEAELPEEEELLPAEAAPPTEAPESTAPTDGDGDGDRPRRRRRRGKRGGRRRGRREEGQEQQALAEGGQSDEESDDDLGPEDQGSEGRYAEDQDTEEREAMTSDRGAAEAEDFAAQPSYEESRAAPHRVVEETKPRPVAETPPANGRADAAPAEEQPESPAEAPAPSFDVITEPDPTRPKRRGWWNRLTR